MSGRELQRIDRRSFLKGGSLGATGLLIGFYLPALQQAHAADSVTPNSAAPGGRVTLNAWIHVSPDGTVAIFIDKSEMGQSILTGLAMIAADELECDWQKVRTEFAPADKVYFNPQFGAQGTGALFPYGPYLRQIPVNPYSNSATIKVITTDPAVAGDVTGTGGWLYNLTSGSIFIDNSTLYTK